MVRCNLKRENHRLVDHMCEISGIEHDSEQREQTDALFDSFRGLPIVYQNGGEAQFQYEEKNTRTFEMQQCGNQRIQLDIDSEHFEQTEGQYRIECVQYSQYWKNRFQHC